MKKIFHVNQIQVSEIWHIQAYTNQKFAFPATYLDTMTKYFRIFFCYIFKIRTQKKGYNRKN